MMEAIQTESLGKTDKICHEQRKQQVIDHAIVHILPIKLLGVAVFG